MKLEKASKYDPRSHEIEAVDKISCDFRNAARQNTSKILWFNMMLKNCLGIVILDFSQFKTGTGPYIVIRKGLKRNEQNTL